MNSEVDIVDYDVIRMDCSKWGGGVACYIKKSYDIIIKQVLVLRLKPFL